MAINLSTLKRGVQKSPPILCIYGDSGIGKTTFAANAPNPVFIFTENGQGNLDLANWKCDSYEEVMEAIVTLTNDEHDFKTLVIDSLDWLETFIWAYMIKDRPTDEKGKPVRDISDYGFGKGYSHALEYWKDFTDLVDKLRTTRNMAIIFVAHETITKVSPPDGDSYDSWSIKLQNADKTSARDKIIEYCDAVLFAKSKEARTEEKLGFGNTRARGIGKGERIVYTERRPAFEAKNRYDLPVSLEIKDKEWSALWGELSTNIPWFSTLEESTEPEIKPDAGKQEANLPKFIKQK